jgi:hypothetical protein
MGRATLVAVERTRRERKTIHGGARGGVPTRGRASTFRVGRTCVSAPVHARRSINSEPDSTRSEAGMTCPYARCDLVRTDANPCRGGARPALVRARHHVRSTTLVGADLCVRPRPRTPLHQQEGVLANGNGARAPRPSVLPLRRAERAGVRSPGVPKPPPKDLRAPSCPSWPTPAVSPKARPQSPPPAG